MISGVKRIHTAETNYILYMVSDLVDDDSTVRVNRKQELVVQKEQAGGNAMIGICYLLETEAEIASVWKNWEEIPDTTERSGRKPIPERQNDCDGPCCTCCRCRRNHL